MKMLGIESSCDETAIAIYDTEQGVLAHALRTQIALHAPFGGVVPELASRNHLEALAPLLTDALQQAQLSLSDIDAFAYTAGPGLIGALLTGACFAKSLALSCRRPAIAVHHLEAHLLVALLDTPGLAFPFVALLVSGGHTMLIEALALGHYRLLGDTLDDAVGEAFDKTAKLLGFPYPGGPKLAALADSYPRHQPLPFPAFPRPMTDRATYDMSFSGLKTHTALAWQRSTQDDTARLAIAFAFQEAIIDTLVMKCKYALRETAQQRLVVAGGVSANQQLRSQLKALTPHVYFPHLAHCTDNGIMIAYTGAQYLQQGLQHADATEQVQVHPRWPFSPLTDK